MAEIELSSFGDFLLGGWVVQPRLNRIARRDIVARLEPRCMDLLVFLARHPMEVHSKERLIDEVWRVEAVATDTLTHEIAALRKALGDDARNPMFIETIHRRGYRLLVTPGPIGDHESSVSRTLSHYLLLEYLGGGGMGVVYRAQDTKLRREVALKFLPKALSGDSEARERFVREARSASALDHPHICTIHEINETPDGQLFIVMARYEGETLRKKIERGPLSVDETVRFAGQIADGLQCAHSEGIVHRDIKPANLMVTTDGVVKILDFGLAKLVHSRLDRVTESAEIDMESSPGALIGTAAYMSPEQVRGQPADHRSDIFTLGVVLYEMLTGKRPFIGSTRSETAAAILSQDPEPISATPGVSPALAAIVSKCLEKHPDCRYQSASNLASDLEGILRDSDFLSTPGVVAPLPRPRRLILWAAAAISLVIVGGVALTSMKGIVKATSQPIVHLDKNSVVVIPFENRSGEASIDAYVMEAARAIQAGLGREERLDPILLDQAANRTETDGDTNSTDRNESLAGIARAQGAATVVSGSISRAGTGFRLVARVVDATTGRLVRVEGPVDAAVQELPDAVEEMNERVMAAIVWHLPPSYYLPAMAEPPQWDAYVHYARGVDRGAFRSQKIESLQRALDRDPDFVAALLALGDRYLEATRWSDQAAIIVDLRTRNADLTPYGREMLSQMEAHVSGNWLECLRRGHRMQELEPRVDLTLWIMWYAKAANRMLEVVEVSDEWLSRSDRKHPHSIELGLRSKALHMLGRYEEELEVARQARALYPDEVFWWLTEARALSALGRLDELQGLLDECTMVTARKESVTVVAALNPGAVFHVAAEELRVHGHSEVSREVAGRLVQWRENLVGNAALTRSQRLGLASAYYLAERWDDARNLYEGLADNKVEHMDSGGDWAVVSYHGSLGVIAARQGNREKALRISADLMRVTGYTFGINSLYRARIATQLGENEQALDLLRQAVADGVIVVDDVHGDPNLETLWDDPDYQELVRPKE